MSKFALVGPTVSQRLFARNPCVGEREREAAGRVNTMAAAFCVDCGLQLTGRYCGACGGSSIESDIQKMSCRDCRRAFGSGANECGFTFSRGSDGKCTQCNKVEEA